MSEKITPHCVLQIIFSIQLGCACRFIRFEVRGTHLR
jgi:hypothetical protein